MEPTPVAFGFLTGVLVGLTGMGRGALMGPMLRVHAWLGHFDLRLTLTILAGSIPGILLGARLSVWSPEWVLRPVLAVVLMVAGLHLIT
ncbi:MAG: TSUP family transporter [Candidatus Methylomirabilia bacterium]